MYSSRVFLEGSAPLWRTGIKDMTELGAGALLYFAVLKYLGVAFSVLMVLSAPAMYLSFVGRRSGEESFGLDRLSLAQAGPTVRAMQRASTTGGAGGQGRHRRCSRARPLVPLGGQVACKRRASPAMPPGPFPITHVTTAGWLACMRHARAWPCARINSKRCG
jgi:hypothetical protein